MYTRFSYDFSYDSLSFEYNQLDSGSQITKGITPSVYYFQVNTADKNLLVFDRAILPPTSTAVHPGFRGLNLSKATQMC